MSDKPLAEMTHSEFLDTLTLAFQDAAQASFKQARINAHLTYDSICKEFKSVDHFLQNAEAMGVRLEWRADAKMKQAPKEEPPVTVETEKDPNE